MLWNRGADYTNWNDYSTKQMAWCTTVEVGRILTSKVKGLAQPQRREEKTWKEARFQAVGGKTPSKIGWLWRRTPNGFPSRNGGKTSAKMMRNAGGRKTLSRKSDGFTLRRLKDFPSRNGGRKLSNQKPEHFALRMPNRSGIRNGGRKKDYSFRSNIKWHPIKET